MRTFEDVLKKLAEWDVDPGEVTISRPAYNYLIKQAEKVLAAEEEEEDEEE